MSRALNDLLRSTKVETFCHDTDCCCVFCEYHKVNGHKGLRKKKQKTRYSTLVVAHGGYTSISIYDSKRTGCGQAHGHVMRFGQLGDGSSCLSTVKEAEALARKVCKLLNAEAK